MCVAINFEVDDAKNFDINLNKPFYYTTKSQDNNLNILRNKKTFNVKENAFFVFFIRLSVARN